MTLVSRVRLSTLYLLVFAATGTWFVPLGSYISNTLGYPTLLGAAYGMIGLATIVSTLFAGMLADRYLAPNRLLALFEIIAGLTLLLVAQAHSAQALLATIFLHCVFYTCSVPLVASLTFGAMQKPEQEFPGVRVFGSVGFIFAGLVIGSIPGAGLSALPLYCGAAIHIVSAVFALTLPTQHPQRCNAPMNIAGMLGLDILRTVRNRRFWILIATVFLMVIPKKLYDAYMNTFLVDQNVRLDLGSLALEPTAIQTGGQIAEMITILLLPAMTMRLGAKGVMLVGMGGWILRFLLWAAAPGLGSLAIPAIVVGILLHGFSYDFFFIPAQIWVDQKIESGARARAQAFFWFILSGVGVLIGSNLAGALYAHFSGAPDRWTKVWMCGAVITAVIAILFALLFDKREGVREERQANVQNAV